MAFLPGDFNYWVNEYGWTQSQIIAYISADYLVILTYAALIAIALRNTWMIIIK